MIPRFLLLLSGFTASFSLSAQQQQGTIFYERKIDVHRHMDDDQMKAMVPQYQTGQYQLLYRDSVCFYNAVPKDEAPDPFDNPGGGGNRIVMRFGGPGDGGVLFRNFSSGQLLEQTTLADVQYVIADSIRPLTWKLSADTLTILSHLCKKATAVSPRNNAPLVAWYCEEIPLPVGPERYGGLPGAILKLDMDNGAFVFTATRLSAAIEAKSIKTPSGKMITRAAFEKKMDEILGPADSHGRRIIRN
ncbi:MAG TPA: GLPGLI family protein [Puia sp.]|jgi:GLPGLI family protein|nr:GLPGLI family protein [Puia sp.]